ncbi:hypothetical protein L1987_17763 [Smallanthus sonchifolius]|uniref:Uncharacterized protein n=1 Tax=Smallanthus sonchifolius TaxID=185202 RepID=A0ACB9IYP5_9ASTR|nr:hypothetical protein L1987_17763 [Smallanthus sonchifolius]
MSSIMYFHDIYGILNDKNNNYKPILPYVCSSSSPTRLHSSVPLPYPRLLTRVPRPSNHKKNFKMKFEGNKSRNKSSSLKCASSSNEKKYKGSKPLCSKCNRYHEGNCREFKCFKCGKPGHSPNECSAPIRCFECNELGHMRFNCPKIKGKKPEGSRKAKG